MKVWDADKKEEVTWAPTNANGYFTGDSMPLRTAFAQSINSVAVRLGQEMGIKNIIETAHNMGIKSKLDETPSLALGSSDVNLLELTNAYCTVANNGKAHPEPILITKIVDRNGNEIYVAPSDDEQALSRKSAFMVQQLLMGGMSGTSSRLRGFVGYDTDTDFGGKTGTSNNHSDAWFIATTPKLVCGAWVGGEYRCIHFRTGELGQGNRTALPICGYFLQNVLKDSNFKQYHAKFGKYEGLSPNDYGCGGYFKAPSDSDSLAVDSLAQDGEHTVEVIDEMGNIVSKPVDHNANQQALPDNKPAAEEPKEE
jgi:penicillin-binding protein 1A